MYEHHLIPRDIEASVARRDGPARHDSNEERQSRRDEDQQALDRAKLQPATTRGVGKTDEARTVGRLGPRREPPSAPRLRASAGYQKHRRDLVSGGRERRRGTTLAPLGNTLLPPLVSPRAKIATFRRLVQFHII